MPLLKGRSMELVPEGYQPATLLEVNEAEGQKGPYLQWEFEVDPYEGKDGETQEGRRLRANSSFAFGPKSKARPWVEALQGDKLPADAEVDTDHLIGRRALLHVIHQYNDDTGQTYAQVKQVLPPLG